MTGGLRDLIEHPVRFHFFTGKGGVGKTSLACATAVGLADRGRRTLLVSACTVPDRVALLEAERTRTELSARGMQNQLLIVNAVFRATDSHDPVALAVEERANKVLADKRGDP